jgi:hypothetical protein
MNALHEHLKAPFPYFGGKRSVAADVWRRLGKPKQYIEPFCGSLAILLAKPGGAASLEVVGDGNGFIANFWRAVKYQPDQVAHWADYPVSHIDQGARHRRMMEMRDELASQLHDPEWPGNAKVAGWWLWGQCSWIGSGWCDWWGKIPHVSNAGQGVQAAGKIPHVGNAGQGVQAAGQIPHVSNAGQGVQAAGKIPHVGNAGQGVQAAGQIPHVGNAGRGVQAAGQIPHVGNAGLMTSGGQAAWIWLHKIANRLERCRIIHGDWDRCLNNHYGADQTAVFLDPPYKAFEQPYGSIPVASAVEDWARDNPKLRIAICGHIGDYDLPGWDAVQWERPGNTYSGTGTKDKECIWYSPGCLPGYAKPVQEVLL